MKPTKGPNFESNLIELESLVEQMERGDLSLEDALTQFERGIGLLKTCQQALQAAEQKVQLLTKADDNESLVELSPLAADAADDD